MEPWRPLRLLAFRTLLPPLPADAFLGIFDDVTQFMNLVAYLVGQREVARFSGLGALLDQAPDFVVDLSVVGSRAIRASAKSTASAYFFVRSFAVIS